MSTQTPLLEAPIRNKNTDTATTNTLSGSAGGQSTRRPPQGLDVVARTGQRKAPTNACELYK